MPRQGLLVYCIFTFTSIQGIFESQAWIQFKSASSNPCPSSALVRETAQSGWPASSPSFAFPTHLRVLFHLSISSLTPLWSTLSLLIRTVSILCILLSGPYPQSPDTEALFSTQAGPLSRNHSLPYPPLPNHNPQPCLHSSPFTSFMGWGC